MTVSEKHREIAKVIYDALGRGSARDEETIARALAAAEREGREDERKRCAEIARQAVIRDADDYWDKCNVAATVAESILSQANTHSEAPPLPGATEAGSVQPSADPATHHASRKGRGEQ